jgi:hypothetical protein
VLAVASTYANAAELARVLSERMQKINHKKRSSRRFK